MLLLAFARNRTLTFGLPAAALRSVARNLNVAALPGFSFFRVLQFPVRTSRSLTRGQTLTCLPGKRVRVCPRASDRLVRTGDCQTLKKLRPGNAADFRFKATLRKAAAGKPKVRVRFRAKASKSKPRGSTGLLIPKG